MQCVVVGMDEGGEQDHTGHSRKRPLQCQQLNEQLRAMPHVDITHDVLVAVPPVLLDDSAQDSPSGAYESHQAGGGTATTAAAAATDGDRQGGPMGERGAARAANSSSRLHCLLLPANK